MRNDVMNIIYNNKLYSVFQPIVSLQNGEILGFEALTRVRNNSKYDNPENLFVDAKEYDLLWELEILSRSNSIKAYGRFNTDKLLFLNVDPNIMKDEHFIKGFTKEILAEYNICPSSLIFEITEKSTIEDYNNFKGVIDYYKQQGYKIAIDDVGTGFSGLTTIAETRPMYIKIDKGLINGVYKDNFKKAIVKSLVEFANATNTKIIAEGIEDVNDLYILIDMGVHYGQGYLFQKPDRELLEVPEIILNRIIEKNESKKRHSFSPSANVFIGEIARYDRFVSPATPCSVIEAMFKDNPNLRCIPIAEGNGTIVGIITQNNFSSKVGTQYGWSLYMKRPIHLIMDPNPLIIDYTTPLDTVSKIVVSREEEKLYDYILVQKNNKYYGVVPIISLLEKSMELELNVAKYANPLTGLPGNVVIENSINQILKEKVGFSLLYFDLNDFKAYNDTYGFEKGDKIISYTAGVIQKYISKYDSGFVGHIGGDDFVAIVKNNEINELCDGIVFEFDNNIHHFYNELDRKKGYICSVNRNNKEECFPIMTLSVAVVKCDSTVDYTNFEISEMAAKTKKECKRWSKNLLKSCYKVWNDA